MTRVLIVDDDPVHLQLTSEVAREAGYLPIVARGGDEALRLIRANPHLGAVILDLVMPDRDGMGVLEAMTRAAIAIPVIVQTTARGRDAVMGALRQGAVDFVEKPVSPERLAAALRNAIRLRTLEAATRGLTHADTDGFVARSPDMQRALRLARKAADSTLPVLVEGEVGTGKSRLARLIHAAGERAQKPFVSVSCATPSASELEVELFGAAGGPRGKFAEANGGTLFIDEIGELPHPLQARLQMVLESGMIQPSGPGRAERVNVRLIAATSRRLLALAQSGELREDLYYRLNILPIYLPPLRARADELTVLTDLFVARFGAEAGRRVVGLSAPARILLASYDWPGNLGQLTAALYRAVILAEGDLLEVADFPQIVRALSGRSSAAALSAAAAVPAAPRSIDLAQPARARNIEEDAGDRFVNTDAEVATLAEVERALIAFALDRYDGHMSKVARALGIGRSTLYRKLRDYGFPNGVGRDAA